MLNNSVLCGIFGKARRPSPISASRLRTAAAAELSRNKNSFTPANPRPDNTRYTIASVSLTGNTITASQIGLSFRGATTGSLAGNLVRAQTNQVQEAGVRILNQ